MTLVIASSEDSYLASRQHLEGHLEQVGFFLAQYQESERKLVLQSWRPMEPDAFEIQSAYHVTLRDEVRPQIIKWAWDAGACLVEAHSHHIDGIACFSSSDICGLTEWVPHVRWRLRGRPYAAIVYDGDSVDALGWLDDRPEQVDSIEVNGNRILTTKATLSRFPELAYGEFRSL